MKRAKWYILVNAAAGKGYNREVWRKVRKELDLAQIEHDGYYSRDLNSFKAQLHKEIDLGTRCFITVGGDGSLHQLINALYTHPSVSLDQFTVACIPMGSGNDWSRTYDFPTSLKKCVKLIGKGHTGWQDLALLTHQNREYIVVNNCGLGYDALVLKKAQSMRKHFLGNLKYLYALLGLLYEHKSSLYKMEIDEVAFESDVFSITIGNCAYNGGGFKQLPHAIPNDGKMDITLIRDIAPRSILLNLHRLFLGTLDHIKHVSSLQAKHIKVDPGEHILIEADGELIGTGKMELKILPHAIKFILPSA